jgi:hypothetical protein
MQLLDSIFKGLVRDWQVYVVQTAQNKDLYSAICHFQTSYQVLGTKTSGQQIDQFRPRGYPDREAIALILYRRFYSGKGRL